jgi:hypothetical protein
MTLDVVTNADGSVTVISSGDVTISGPLNLTFSDAYVPPEPPIPEKPRFSVGARCKTGPDDPQSGNLGLQWKTGVETFGPLSSTRAFEVTLPAAPTYFTPDGVDEIISFKSDPNGNLEAFVKALRGTKPKIINHHEPEADYANGADFVREWDGFRNRAKAARPDVQFGMIAGAYQYRTGKAGVSGSFLPPDADWYGIDTYRKGTDAVFNAVVPLAKCDEFLRWRDLVADKNPDAPLWVTEYGRGLVPTPAKQRMDTMNADVAYLKEEGFAGILYWWSNRSNLAAEQWRFTDPGSIETWSALVAENAPSTPTGIIGRIASRLTGKDES